MALSEKLWSRCAPQELPTVTHISLHARGERNFMILHRAVELHGADKVLGRAEGNE